MPAVSCRIMPARSISRCETISASFGFSFRMGRKNRDNRMGTLKESVNHGKSPVKPDRVRKHKGGLQSRPLRQRISCCFAGDLNRTIKAPAGTTSSNPLAHRHVEFVFQRDPFKIVRQSVHAQMTAAGKGD